MKDRFRLTFPRERIPDPVVCEVAKKFEVTFSIRRANVEADSGWMDLQLDGTEEEINRAIGFLEERGVRVDPVEGDIIAG
jgi:ABC-type methionine transport system ATPase subunit